MAKTIEILDRRDMSIQILFRPTGRERHVFVVGSAQRLNWVGLYDPWAGATISTMRPAFFLMLLADALEAPPIASGTIKVEGDAALYVAITELIESFVPNFLMMMP